MRPQSIIRFEWLYLASIVVGLLNNVLNWPAMVAAAAEDPRVQNLGSPSSMAMVAVAIGVIINLLLWYFVARRRSNIARWLLVILVAIGLVMMLSNGFAQHGLTVSVVLAVAAVALQLVAIWELFRPDAAAWFRGTSPD